MYKAKWLAVVGICGLVLSACGSGGNSPENAHENPNAAEVSEKNDVSTQEPGLDQLDQKTKDALSRIGSEEEINWDEVHLNKRQFKEYIEGLAENHEADDSDIKVTSSKMTDDKTIEITFENTDTSQMSQLSDQAFAFFVDSFSRQLYLHSDFSDETTHPTIIIKDEEGNIVSEATDFIETDSPEASADQSGEADDDTVGKRSNPISLTETATQDFVFFNDNGEKFEGIRSLTLSNVMRGDEAYNYLMEQNPYNEPAPEGMEWVIVDVEYKLDKANTEDYPVYVSPDFKVIGSDGSQISQDAVYATFDGNEFGYVELYSGGTAKGKYAFYAPVGDEVLLEYNDWNNPGIFFSLN